MMAQDGLAVGDTMETHCATLMRWIASKRATLWMCKARFEAPPGGLVACSLPSWHPRGPASCGGGHWPNHRLPALGTIDPSLCDTIIETRTLYTDKTTLRVIRRLGGGHA